MDRGIQQMNTFGPRKVEQCARCGHRSGRCPHCGTFSSFLGGTINQRNYCHTFVDSPSCYDLESRATTADWREVEA